MKPLLLIAFCTHFSLAGTCQDSTITYSSFEMFSSRSGIMLKKETKEVGTVGSLLVTKLKATDITSQSSVYAIRVGYNDNTISILDPATLYIDLEELDSVITVMTYFMKEVNELKMDERLRFSYITKGDIEISFNYAKWTGNWRFSLGRVYKVLRSAVPYSNITLNKRRVSDLMDLLNQSKCIKL